MFRDVALLGGASLARIRAGVSLVAYFRILG